MLRKPNPFHVVNHHLKMENVHRVSIDVEKHYWKFWRTRNDVGTRDKKERK